LRAARACSTASRTERRSCFSSSERSPDLLVEFRDQAHHQDALDIGRQRFIARGAGRRGRGIVLDDLGEQRHLFDRAQRVLLLALHQGVDPRDERILLALLAHDAAFARSWLRIS
jgi:hypothetical protein